MNSLLFLIMGGSAFAQLLNRPNDGMIQRLMLESGTEQTLSSADVRYELNDFYVSKQNGIQHIYFRQQWNGLEIIGTESAIHLDKSGKPAQVHNQFVNSLAKRAAESATEPQLTAMQAVNSASQHLGYGPTNGLAVQSTQSSPNRLTQMNDGGISLRDIQSKLVYYLTTDGDLKLAWELAIDSKINADYFNIWIDAQTGELIDKVNWTSSCGFDHGHEHDGVSYHFHGPEAPQQTIQTEEILGSYRVFAMPLESPFYGERTLVSADDAVNVNASPYGWHDTNGSPGPEYTTTRGNNVNAYEDGDNSGFQPSGGSGLVFDFPFGQNYNNSNQYEPAAITNLFYWNNIIHDVFYEYGFDEVSGNFQQNNYGKGGAQNDYVWAEAQDGSGTCNANFSTPPDGNNPRMQMYICGNKDGDFDNVVITHEYGHGISIRLTGGPSNSNCLNNNEQMGEGWSDWFGLMLTMTESDSRDAARGIGTYLFGQGPGAGGIRTYPYSCDMGINPHTYNSIKSEAAPHGVGSVWAVMLWEMTWDLIDKYGFDSDIYNGTGGNNIAMKLVVEGLKLQPCSPGFVDGRDAILLADQLLFDGENQCLIWDAFARRGLGYSASQGSSNSKSDGVEAYDTPSSEADFVAPNDVCVDKGLMTGLSGGTPFGGVYSGPGVTDDGNGMTYTFDPVEAGVGIHTIMYSVEASSCADASSAIDTIEVTEGLHIECPEDITVGVSADACEAVVNFAMPEGLAACMAVETENFDGVSRPSLPSGWTTTSELGNNNAWTTVNTQSASSPNAAFAQNRAARSLSSLVSPQFAIANPNAILRFKLYYHTEGGYDGVVLEYSENNGAWKDILNAGGSFSSGAYNTTLSNHYQNPLSARQAWSGNSNGFIQVEINLNSNLAGKNVKFRWRMGSDQYVSETGVWLDDVEVEGVDAPGPITTQVEGLPSGSTFPLGTTVNTFEVTSNGTTKTCSFTVTVIDDQAPEIVCPEVGLIEIEAGQTYGLPDYWAEELVSATDNCNELTEMSQNPAPGTQLGEGTYTINLSVKDAAGNESECSFELKIDEIMGVGDCAFGQQLQIYPNPTQGQFVIVNPTQEKIIKVLIHDLSGKMLEEVKLNSLNKENKISIEHYPSGSYLIQIVGEKQSSMKKIIKK